MSVPALSLKGESSLLPHQFFWVCGYSISGDDVAEVFHLPLDEVAHVGLQFQAMG